MPIFFVALIHVHSQPHHHHKLTVCTFTSRSLSCTPLIHVAPLHKQLHTIYLQYPILEPLVSFVYRIRHIRYALAPSFSLLTLCSRPKNIPIGTVTTNRKSTNTIIPTVHNVRTLNLNNYLLRIMAHSFPNPNLVYTCIPQEDPKSTHIASPQLLIYLFASALITSRTTPRSWHLFPPYSNATVRLFFYLLQRVSLVTATSITRTCNSASPPLICISHINTCRYIPSLSLVMYLHFIAAPSRIKILTACTSSPIAHRHGYFCKRSSTLTQRALTAPSKRVPPCTISSAQIICPCAAVRP